VPPALTSEEVNFLVYRYLLESGFIHSAFVFGSESFITKTTLTDTNAVPPGALISFIQKGLQYLEIESHINDDGTETVCTERFSVLKPHVCRVQKRKRIFDPYEPVIADYGALEIDPDEAVLLSGHKDLVCACVWNPVNATLASCSVDGSARIWDTSVRNQGDKNKPGSQERDGKLISTSSIVLTPKPTVTVSPEDASKESKDKDKDKEDEEEGQPRKRQRTEGKDGEGESADKGDDAGRSGKAKAVQSLITCDWSADGELLASGCYDGSTQLWNAAGTLTNTLYRHTAPVCCVKWNNRGGSQLLTTSMDNTVCAWTSSGKLICRYDGHQGACLDADWQSADTFASCSTDKTIRVQQLDTDTCIQSFTGHKGDVNAVRWNTTGELLASCSEDCTLKLWRVGSSSAVRTMAEHTREVNVIAWGRVHKDGLKGEDTDKDKDDSTNTELLASGSLDTLVKVWNPDTGACKHTLHGHIHPVVTLAFSPSGEFLASGSHDRLHIWAVSTGEMHRTFKGDAGINHVTWNSEGDQLAVGYSDNSIYLLDLRS